MAYPSPPDTGLTLTLPTGYHRPDGVDWRAAVFSVAFPVPATALPTTAVEKRFTALGPQWTAGRFNGIAGIEIPGPDGRKSGGYTPKNFPADADKRFSSSAPLQQSVGATPDDDHRFHHRLFGDTLALQASDGSAITLACAEFLQYRGARAHDSDDRAVEIGIDYLVLHVVVENSSSGILDKVSRALHRPNQKPARFPLSAAPGAVAAPEDDRLLPFFLAQVVTALNTDLPETASPDHGFVLTVEAGGFLKGRRTGNTRAGGLTAGEGTLVRVNGRRTIRSVCAVPGRTDIGVPPQFAGFLTDDQLADTETYWSRADMWAWSLSAGSDQYAEGIPDLRHDHAGDRAFGGHHFWSTATSPCGVAVVRTCPAGNHDTKPWRLSPTRTCDLLLLVHRSREYLSQLSTRLRDFHFRLPADVDDIADRTAAEDNLRSLQHQSRHFGDIQADLVFFRDHLWFDTVPDQETDTRTMQAYRDATGVTGLYEDISSEIQLRKEVYSTLHQSVSLQLDRILGGLKEKEHERQVERDRQRQDQVAQEAQAREAEREARHDQDSLQNKILAFIAVVFAVPGVVQLVPGGTSWPLFAGTAVLIVMLMAVGWSRLRAAQKSNT